MPGKYLYMAMAAPWCSGLTFEPGLRKWTLRAGSTPIPSLTGEISMLLSCLNQGGRRKSYLSMIN